MNLQPKDRRGLSEIVSWSTATVMTGAIVVGYLLRGWEPPHAVAGIFVGAVTLLLARGTQSAAERSGSSEAKDREAMAMREARDELAATTKRMETIIDRVLDRQIDHYLPPPLSMPAKKE